VPDRGDGARLCGARVASNISLIGIEPKGISGEYVWKADAKARRKRAARLNDPELLAELDAIKRRMNGGASFEHPDDRITDTEPGLVWRHASEIELESIVWLWPGRIARGKHTCIAGDPGTGKSQLAIAIAAAISTGGEWPCGEGRAPLGSGIILSAEDGAGDTILPRLYAVGADCGRVYIVDAVREEDGGERTFNLKSDLASLENMIAERGDVVLVIIDTVNSYLGKTDSHKNAEVRAVLDPLSKMAERMRVAVLSITHFSKGGSNSTTKALHRFLGSIGFVGSPRAAFATFEDPMTQTAACSCMPRTILRHRLKV
jgi:hypothetical protein